MKLLSNLLFNDPFLYPSLVDPFFTLSMKIIINNY